MNEEERVDRVGGDGADCDGDRGGVQPTSPSTSIPDTYRGPYGEPIVIPATDDPEADGDTRAKAFARRYGDTAREYRCALAHSIRYHLNRDRRPVVDSFSLIDPGSGQSDHGTPR